MSPPYAEGEAFFHRDSLTELYKDDPNGFYKYFLVEYIYNEPETWGPDGDYSPNKSHPYARQGDKTWMTPDKKIFIYTHWDSLVVSYGAPGQQRQHVERILNAHHAHPKQYYERRLGQQPQYVDVMKVPMPTSQEEWIWLNCLLPIRAVYFPLSIQASEEYPHLCTFAQINFYRQGSRPVWHTDMKEFRNHPFTREKGIGFHSEWEIGINVAKVIALLSIPRQFRKTDIWEAKMIMFEKVRQDGPTPSPKFIWPPNDYVDLVNASTAVELTWQPPPRPSNENTFWWDIICGVLAVPQGIVPLIAPLLSGASSIGMTIVTDKGAALAYLRSDGWPDNVLDALVRSAVGLSDYIHPGWMGNNFLPPSSLSRGMVATTEKEKPKDPIDPITLPPNPLLLDGLRAMTESFEFRPPEHLGEKDLHDQSLVKAVRMGLMALNDALKIQDSVDKKRKFEEIEKMVFA